MISTHQLLIVYPCLVLTYVHTHGHCDPAICMQYQFLECNMKGSKLFDSYEPYPTNVICRILHNYVITEPPSRAWLLSASKIPINDMSTSLHWSRVWI